MANRRPVDLVIAELEAVGLDWSIDYGKHLKVRFQVGTRKLMYVVAGTPKDNRTADNCRAGIRRLLRENGVQPSTR